MLAYLGLPLAIFAAIGAGALIGLLLALLAYWRLLRAAGQSITERCARNPDCIRIDPPAVHCDRGLPPGRRSQS